MKKLNDIKKMKKYILKYKINEIFTEDMTEYMNLFFFRKNEHICKESVDMRYLFFFVEGKVKVYITLPNGKSLLLCFYENFKVFGDVEMIDLREASSNIQVVEDSYCIGISLKDVKAHLLNDPKFLRFACTSLGEKLGACSKNSSINLLYPLKNRLARYILVTDEEVTNNGERIIKFDGNLTEVSELLGTSYRHLLRTLKDFCDYGAIKKKENYFEVIDEKILKKLALDVYK